MPYTKKQTRYLLSDLSPLTEDQQEKIKGELRANPSLSKKPAVAPVKKMVPPLKRNAG